MISAYFSCVRSFICVYARVVNLFKCIILSVIALFCESFTKDGKRKFYICGPYFVN